MRWMLLPTLLVYACNGGGGTGPEDDDPPDLDGLTFTGTAEFPVSSCTPVPLKNDPTPFTVTFEITQRGRTLDVIDTANNNVPFTGTIDDDGNVTLRAVLTTTGSIGEVNVNSTETVTIDLQLENGERRLRGTLLDEQLFVQASDGRTFTSCLSSGTIELNRLAS